MYDTPTTDRIGKAYDDMTAMPPMDCSPLQFGFEKLDGKWVHPPKACTFTKNRVMRTLPFKQPLVNLGLTEDLRLADNVAYEAEAGAAKAYDEPWAKGFRWEKENPDLPKPKGLPVVDAGPEAP